MADNHVDPYDYFMADEGDMSDFLDDADEEYYGVAAGNDTALDDYDVVSFFLNIVYILMVEWKTQTVIIR